jgi:hypothetical protein
MKPSPYFVLDTHLDNSRPWRVRVHGCRACGETSIIALRVDRDPICPRCHPDRDQRVTTRDANAVQA